MFLGLLISAGVSYFVSTSETMLKFIYGNIALLIILIVIQIAIVVIINFIIYQISAEIAIILFFIYSVLLGLTFSAIFIIYESNSIYYVFMITSLIFAIMSLLARFTDKDLTSFGTILIVGLIVIIIAGFINIFIRNSMLELIITIVAIIIFSGLIAYDTQKIKNLKEDLEHRSDIKNEKEKEELSKKIAILGALALYIDFTNLFIRLLKLLGKRK